MTIPTSLATLKTAIEEQRERTDAAFVAMESTFVALAEVRLNRLVPVRLSEVDTTSLTATISSSLITLPTDFLEAKALFLTTYGVEQPLTPFVIGTAEIGTTNAPPEHWAINGGSIQLDAPADAAHTFRFRYRKKLFDLATTDPNWLLTNNPDCYLWACCMEAAAWERDMDALAMYEARFQSAKDEIRWLENRAKALAPLRVDPALVGSRPFNITTGQ